MAFQFSKTLSAPMTLRQPRSSDSFQSFAGRKHALGAHRRDIGNQPTLYNIETNEPLPVRSPKSEWSIASIEVSTLDDRFKTMRGANWPLWWTAAVAVVPFLTFTLTFVGVVIKDRVRRDLTSPFDDVQVSENDWRSILVRFSPTRLVFIAGFGGTIAPMMLGCLMTLWHYHTSIKLERASQSGETRSLPTPQQLSLIVGLSAGSLDELRKYMVYHFRRSKAKETPLLTASAALLLSAATLAGIVLLADIGIHNFTTTVSISQSVVETNPTQAYGRGLAPHCIDFDRKSNQGLPCTVVADASVGANAIAFDSGAIISMQANKSDTNSAWQVLDTSNPDQDLKVLMPQTTQLDADRDFQASTIAVSTQCTPTTEQCNVRINKSTNPNDTYILFNCTDNFRGVLGAPETIAADTISWAHTDDTTPNFNFKLDRNFQYAYFTDPALTTPYNSIGGDPNNTTTDSTSTLSLPDPLLLATYHLAIAGLVPAQQPSLLSSPPNLALPIASTPLIAYTLNCTVTAHSLTYTWYANTIRELTHSPLTNGSILELAHGMQAMGMPSLSQAQSLASLSPNMTTFARTYANLHSADTLALIASVMTPRTNLQEARRQNFLVAKSPLWTFLALIIANGAFVIFASALAVRALVLSSAETRDMVAKLSVEGLAAAAFEDRNGKQDPGGIVAGAEEMFEERRIGGASRRIALRKAVGGSMALRIEQPNL